ncbi:MAG: 50S ribosomal protein L34e [Candidatus Micrarchaeota archaeon]|nr:50S ribosomal protein L34e [Candidatus Micrarchaeota archaeon]
MKRSDYRKKSTSRKTPSGRTAVIFRKKKPKVGTCAMCDTRLFGVPRASRSAVRKLAKTERRPERMFGGVLCGNCTQHHIKTKARLSSGALSEKDVAIRERPFLKQIR